MFRLFYPQQDFPTESEDEAESSSKPPTTRSRRCARITEADLLREQFLLCQEQRSFFQHLNAHTTGDVFFYTFGAKRSS
ncbi:hypothetical protein OESDEN_17509 [Oesophagostomum dentatum]|uniref:Uncharacterized protein n=1 Tax=Oesophagostomum dentatum TaxID=61180 RepID=A0A0B1SFX7_OESDE|nr:hypothetical protein OESDEN_17509 [Oesophagostomum dentatum]